MTIDREITEQRLFNLYLHRLPFDKCAGEAVDSCGDGKAKVTPFFTSFFLDLLLNVCQRIVEHRKKDSHMKSACNSRLRAGGGGGR